MKKLFLCVCVALIFAGCKSNDDNEPTTTTQKNATSAIYFNTPMAFIGTFAETSNAMLQLTENQSNNLPRRMHAQILTQTNSTYPIIDWTPKDTVWPKTVTIDYGATTVTGVDGLEHRGKISINATGLFEEVGSVIKPTFDNYYVYNNILTGTQTITNKGRNNSGNLEFEVVVENGNLDVYKHFTYSENTIREMINGLQEDGRLNPDVKTHKYSITGEMRGTSKVDSLSSCIVKISNDTPMVIGVGDVCPTEGRLMVEFEKHWAINLSNLIGTSSLPATTQAALAGLTQIAAKKISILFNGKKNNAYNVTAEISTEILTVQKTISVNFNVDKNGIIPSSLQFGEIK